MAKNIISNITVQGKTISISTINEQDYICLTDMIKQSDADDSIRNWMRNKNTIEFLGVWESINNPNFKGVEFDTFMNEAGLNRFNMTPRKWVEGTNAIGIVSKSGKHGGTFAHKDIAFEFAAWISPIFKLYLIKEFQRLKEDELKQIKSSEWLYQRFVTKANYILQTDAVKKYLVPNSTLPEKKLGILYASEAELVNYGTLGYTAKEWSSQHPKLAESGNLREYLAVEELIVLDNMQNLNSVMISQGLSQQERLEEIQQESAKQLRTLLKSKTIAKAKEITDDKDFNNAISTALSYNPNEHKDDF